MPQHRDVSDRFTTVSEHDGHISEHLTPIMAWGERPTRQRRRQRAGQPSLVSQKTQASTTDMGYHTGPIASYFQPGRPRSTLHLRSAFQLEKLEPSQVQESPAGQALPCIHTRTTPITRERSGLIAERVTLVVMESTGDYWKPFYYLLEDAVNVMLVNPRDARNRPGRKTDVSDSAWLADLGAHGLLRASLVPPPPIRRLRDLTRARTDLNRDRVRQIHRLEKLLQDAGIKLPPRRA